MRRQRILTIPRSTGDTLQTAPAMSTLGTTERRSNGSSVRQLAGIRWLSSPRPLVQMPLRASTRSRRRRKAPGLCRRWTALQPRAARPCAPCIHPAGKDSAIMVRVGAGRRFQPKPHGFQPYRRHRAPRSNPNEDTDPGGGQSSWSRLTFRLAIEGLSRNSYGPKHGVAHRNDVISTQSQRPAPRW